MIFASFGRPRPPRPPRRPPARRYYGGGYGPGYVTDPYVETVVVTLPACTTRPNPVPPCAGNLYWRDANTVCCGR